MIALGLSTKVAAQGFQLSGHVMRVAAADTIPVVDHWVVMHQISTAGGTAVDSVRTDRSGAYYVRSPRRDTSALYMSSIEYLGITYFSPPVRTIEFTSDTAETLLVYDTSSVQPAVTLAQRYVVVRAPNDDGSRSILELLSIANSGTITRIAGDGVRPVWRGTIPTGALDLEIGDSDVSPEAISRMGDTLSVTAPIPPGEKQLVVAYKLPGSRTFSVATDQPVERLEVLLEDTAAVLTEGPLRRVGDEMMDTLRFARYDASNVPSGTPIAFQFSRPPLRVQQFWWILVLGAALAFAVTVALWWKGIPTRLVVDDPNVLAARIAALDESFEGRGADASQAERTAYERSRGELKARLTAALARRSSDG